jgi:hypothetical protein
MEIDGGSVDFFREINRSASFSSSVGGNTTLVQIVVGSVDKAVVAT